MLVRKSVDSIVASIAKMVAQLREVEEKTVNATNAIREKVAGLKSQQVVLDAEGSRASRIAEKLERIID